MRMKHILVLGIIVLMFLSACANTTNTGDAKNVAPASAVKPNQPSPAPGTCTGDSDCSNPGERCCGGQCKKVACITDIECGNGQKCIAAGTCNAQCQYCAGSECDMKNDRCSVECQGTSCSDIDGDGKGVCLA